jgi:tripartite-type tricarboxylate transporter receptor subunit TctC
VASPAGGPVDALARLVSPGMAAALGQPVVVQNVPGAAGVVGVERLVRSPPDGHTLALSGDAAVVVRTSMEPRPPYDPRRDLAPVSLLAAAPNLFVVAYDVPARDLRGLVALARARPGALGYAHTGPGTSQHIAGELLRQTAGLGIVAVSYNNPGAQVQDGLAGRVAMTFASAATALPRARSGDWFALGVTHRSGSRRRRRSRPWPSRASPASPPRPGPACWRPRACRRPSSSGRTGPRWRRCARRNCNRACRSWAYS